MVLPGATYTPERGLILSAAALRYVRPAASNRLSRIMLQGGGSFDRRGELDFDPEIYFRNGRLILDGSSQLTYFDYAFFGIGNDTHSASRENYTAFRFNARVELIYRLAHGFYLGGLYDTRYENIVATEPGGLLDTGSVTGSGGGFLTGIGVLARYDTRDSSIAPRRGGIVTLTPRFYGRMLGSSFGFTRWVLDASWFFGIRGAHVIGLDGRAEFRTGNPPFDHLSQAGGGRLLRGMLEGRFRDNHYIASQVEYRFPIYWRFGGVAFAGLGRVASAIDELDLTGLKYSAGAGLRFAVRPAERINVRLDVGRSVDGFNAYLRILEAF